jgi:hypothetical protein
VREAARSAGSGPDEFAALLASDQALAERLGWTQALPLHLAVIHDPALKHGRDGRRPRAGGPEWADLCHPVLLRAATAAHADAVMLARRAVELAAAAAALRTRDEGGGLALILADDSVAPWRMAGQRLAGRAAIGSDRAARRLCETLQARGCLRLLTARPAFRLYGL